MPTYVIHDINGRYKGHIIDEACLHIPDVGNFIRELTVEEVKKIANNYKNYNYNLAIDEQTVSYVLFIVGSPSVYEIGVHNKISISVTYTPDEFDSDLLDQPIEIMINNQVTYVTYGSQVFLDPSIPGTYVIKLTDSRVIADDMVHVISVISSS